MVWIILVWSFNLVYVILTISSMYVELKVCKQVMIMSSFFVSTEFECPFTLSYFNHLLGAKTSQYQTANWSDHSEEVTPAKMYSIEVLAVSALTLFVVLIGAASGNLHECRCVASDNCWPNDTEWDAFNKTVGGRLIAPKPTGGLLMHASISF